MFLTLNMLIKFDRTMPSYAQYRRIVFPIGRRRVVPEVVLVRRWAIGVLGVEGGWVWGGVGSGEVSLQAT